MRRNGGKLQRTDQRGKRTGVNIRVATAIIRGSGEVEKKMLLEKWADQQHVDVVCVIETYHPYNSTEYQNNGLHVEDEKVRWDSK